MNKKLSFQYKHIRQLTVDDIGNEGVNLRLTDDHDELIGIFLPPEIVKALGLWLLDTNGQVINQLPPKLLAVLKSLMFVDISQPSKNVIKKAIKILEDEKARDGKAQNP